MSSGDREKISNVRVIRLELNLFYYDTTVSLNQDRLILEDNEKVSRITSEKVPQLHKRCLSEKFRLKCPRNHAIFIKNRKIFLCYHSIP